MMKNLLLRPFRTSLCSVVAVAMVGLSAGADAQTEFTYIGDGEGGGSLWLTTAFWTGGTSGQFPGLSGNTGHSGDGTVSDMAVFSDYIPPGGKTVRVNMGSGSNGANGSLTLGAVRFLASSSPASSDFAIVNSNGTTDGFIKLTGNTINGVDHTIISNESAYALGFRRLGITNNRLLDLQLGNADANVIQINGSGNVEISSQISAGSGVSNPNLTLDGSGTGSLILTGQNSYGGTTLIRRGTLVAGSSTALGTSEVTLGGFSNAATLRIKNGVVLDLASLALTQDALLSFELGAVSATTKITASGQLGNGTYQVGIVDVGGLEAGEYVLLETTGWDAAGFSLAAPVAGFEDSYLSWDSGVLKLTVIPEPGVGALALCSGVALLGLWRLRRK
ncbi:MAG TPA: hypothetical protein VNQ90_10565 [Chthoniobacteraceae bacterium]|nr:hypothetical protein [Chthoniobacteraceae bacterium]